MPKIVKREYQAQRMWSEVPLQSTSGEPISSDVFCLSSPDMPSLLLLLAPSDIYIISFCWLYK